MTLKDKFRILTEGAKYDVSCSSSGVERGAQKGKIGLTNVGGVCHSFTADGRCISLLKILLTNNCIYNCKYCVNRSSKDVERAMLEPEELCELVMGFYQRNYIEGLFLSSAVFRSPDYTMELLVRTVSLLRNKYRFAGYIHMKGIPSCSPELIEQATKLVDRMSMNIELPSPSSLKMLAPEKKQEGIITPMRQLSELYIAQKEGEFRGQSIIPAGQTTQMIVGASPETDGTIIHLSEGLYRRYQMKRVYYSAYVPLGDPGLLPQTPPNLLRENRLYQADWLLRFYGFNADELLPRNVNLNYDIDPKSDWALRNLDRFPIEVNTAPYEMLLRVPGIGVRNAWRIREARKHSSLSYEDLKKMRVVMKRATNFITIKGVYYGRGFNDELIRNALILPAFSKAAPEQLKLFDFDGRPLLPDAYTAPGLPEAETVLGEF